MEENTHSASCLELVTWLCFFDFLFYSDLLCQARSAGFSFLMTRKASFQNKFKPESLCQRKGTIFGKCSTNTAEITPGKQKQLEHKKNTTRWWDQCSSRAFPLLTCISQAPLPLAGSCDWFWPIGCEREWWVLLLGEGRKKTHG